MAVWPSYHRDVPGEGPQLVPPPQHGVQNRHRRLAQTRREHRWAGCVREGRVALIECRRRHE